MNKYLRRVFLLTLSTFLVIQSVPVSPVSALGSGSSPDNSLLSGNINDGPIREIAEDSNRDFTVLVNGTAASQASISYLQPLSFSLQGFTAGDGQSNTIKYFYRDATDPESEWSEIEDGSCTLDPGTYYLSYSYTDTGYQTQSGPDASNMITVRKGQISAPTNLHWDSSNPSWTAVTTTTDAGDLSSAVQGKLIYTLIVYKNGTELKRYTASSVGYSNFSNYITSEENFKNGVYTFGVEVSVPDDIAKYYSNSSKVMCDVSFMAPEILVHGMNGIASVTPNSSDVIVMIPGATTPLTITATPKTGYQFTTWEATGVTFADATAASTTMTVNAGYSEGTTLNVYAKAKDVTAPIVGNLTNKANDLKHLYVTAEDKEDGIKYYAFSKAADFSSVAQDEWIEITPATGSNEYSFELKDGGTYYFYAKDVEGNYAKSASSVQVTPVNYYGYSSKDSQDRTDYIIGTSAVTLPTPSRTSYAFGGWYTDAKFTTEAAASYSAHQSTPYEVYAKWTPLSIPDITIDNVIGGYNTSETVLDPNITDLDNVEYVWTKDGEVVSNNKTYSVKNVADSGTYTLTINLKDVDGNTIGSKTSDEIIVAITPASLSVTAVDKEITFGDEKPELTYNISGLLGTDTKDVVSGTISCAYTKGDPAGDYDIVLSDFSADNYTIGTTNAKLTVKPAPATPTITFKDPKEYTYDPDVTPTPAIEVTLGTTVLDASAYDVEYTDNTQAGTASIKVTLKGNHSGTATETFTIKKADMATEVTMNGWKYGETENAPSLTVTNADNGTIKYWYRLKDTGEYSTVKPVNAGTYEIYATIDETTNYNAVTTDVKEFTIAQRKITITANSNTFTYDGLAHSDNGYEQTGDGFATGQGFYSLSVNGSVTSVTADDVKDNNTISYVLTSNTLAGNYDIECIPGTLKIIPETLAVPYNAKWSDTDAGKATWVKVSRKNLDVQYEVELFAYDGSEYTSVKTATTSENNYDFKEEIRSHAKDNEDNNNAYSYFFRVKAVPYKNPDASGESIADNYQESTWSDYNGEVFTTKLNIVGDHLKDVTLGEAGETTYTAVNGEKVSVSAKTDEGYAFKYPVVYDSGQLTAENINAQDESYSAIYVPKLTAVGGNLDIKFNTEDIAPVILSVEASANSSDTYKSVDFEILASDRIGLAQWAVVKGTSTPTDSDWHEVAKVDGEYPNTNTEITCTADEPGDYYVYVRDTGDNVTKYAKPITVYQIDFAKGDENATGTMASVLKVSDQTITLPENTFTYKGYSFSNWKGSTGIYADKGKMSANPSSGYEETLTAIWAKNTHTYNVEYYLMGLDGNYPSDPTETKTFSTIFNAVITSDKTEIQLDLVGFERDTSKNESITITEQGMSLKVYYERNKYELTKRYQEPSSEYVTVDTQEYYYGTDLTTVLGNKPSVDGYDFVGWLFGDNGNEPKTMPANNVIATGHFVPKQVEYHINYYLQDLESDGVTAANTYTLLSDKSKTLGAEFDAALTMDQTLAEEVEGYSYKGANATAKAYDDTTITLPEDIQGQFSTTAAEGKVINVFFDRNTYTATLNVWKGKVNQNEPIYTTSINLLYGATIPSDLPDLNKAQWPAVDDDAYKLADYVGWSTGETAPSTMPAGNVTVTRQYVSKVTGTYNVEVYLETVTDGVYENPKSFTFYETVGTNVSVGNDTTDTIQLSSFKNGIYAWDYYELSTVDPDPNILSGKVTDTNEGEDPLVLKVYMDRKKVSCEIKYYVGDSEHNQVLVAQVTKYAKWGHTFHYDALSIFGSNEGGVWTEGEEKSNLDIKSQVSGSDPDIYNFKANNYVVSYNGSGITNDTYRYFTYDYNTVATLSENPEIEMRQRNNNATVRYSKAEPEKMYRIRLTYNANNLQHISGTSNVPLTYTDNGKQYEAIYVANEAYFYDNVTYDADGYTDYPGLAFYNVGTENDNTKCKYVYSTDDSNVKAGFTKVTIGGSTYFESVEDGKNILYIPDTANKFYVGKHASFYVSDSTIGYQDVLDFLSNYKATYSDAYAQGAYVYNRSWGSTVKYNTIDTDLTITFLNGEVYQVSYNLGGAICSDETHKFAAGSTVHIDDPDEFGCEHELIMKRAGYDVVWYTDPGCTTQQTTDFTLNSDKVFYGRYEKTVLKNEAYTYFELADHIDGKSYLTEDEIIAIQQDEPLRVAESTSDSKVTITNEFNESVEVDVKTIIYSLDGNVVLVKTEVPSNTFQAVSYDFTKQSSYGLKYDDSNPNNVNAGYVQSDAITFAAYYVREKVDLFVDKKIENVNVEQTTHRAGETITVDDPERNGYTFAGWKFYDFDKDSNNFVLNQTFSNTHANNKTTFTMPEGNFKLEATWDTSSYTQKKYHYFQNGNTRAFEKEAVLAVEGTTGTAGNVKFDDVTYSAVTYENGMVSFEKDGNTYYFLQAENGSVKIEDLCAIVSSGSSEQEADVKIEDDILSIEHYNYAYTLRQYEKEIKEYDDKSNTYVNAYGMTLEHFYNLETFVITTDTISIGGNGQAVVIGADTYLYGQNAVLKASLPSGYTLVGWYRTVNLNNLPSEPTVDDFKDLTKAASTATFTTKVVEDRSYTVVISADDVAEPTLTINGPDQIVYKSEDKSSMSVKAEFEAGDETSYLESYQWYKDGEKIEGATGADFIIPNDWDVGTYKLTCVVTVARRDNGMKKEFTTSEHSITINPSDLEDCFKSSSHTAAYDGTDQHSIEVKVNTTKKLINKQEKEVPVVDPSEYTIYYSEEEITKDNYQQLVTDGKASTVNFKYTNVAVKDEVRGSYTVYYYVAPKNNNYTGFGGSETVTITPLPLTAQQTFLCVWV